MILVDTSIWIDHFHIGESALAGLLDQAEVSSHPMVLGELALGSLRNRDQVLALLAKLPTVLTATHAEVLRFVQDHALYGTGLSLVDVHLLAAAMLTPETQLWTRDKRLRAAAERLSAGWSPE